MLDWDRYIAIAEKFQYRARREDRDDLRQNIILSLAEAQRSSGALPLTAKSMLRIALYECQKYWRQVRRTWRVISLSTIIGNGDGRMLEIGDIISDAHSGDIDARLSAQMELYRYPARVLEIGRKIVQDETLSNREHQYLWRFRHKNGGKGLHF